jgi:hypothetical protein
MKYVSVLLLTFACFGSDNKAQDAWYKWRKHHNISLAANALAAGTDMWTTNRLTRTGLYVEANPLVLGLRDGHFGARAVVINGSIIAASGIAQKLIARRYPRTAKWFAVFNYSNACLHTAAFVRNLRMR